MDILYRDVPEYVFNLIADKQTELKKKKRRHVSQPEALTALIKSAYPENVVKGPPKKKT